MMKDKICVLFMIESMKTGGAERQLHELLTGLNRSQFSARLITWVPRERAFNTTNYQWDYCPRKYKMDLAPVFKAAKLLKDNEIDIIHGFLDTGNLYAVLARLLAGKGIALASERSSLRPLGRFQGIHKPWSHKQATLTVCNSKKGVHFLKRLGIHNDKIKFIPNGVDNQIFHPVKPSAVDDQKKELGLDQSRSILLCVGRVTPIKNQIAILQSFGASKLKDTFDLVIIGEPDGKYLDLLNKLITALELGNKVKLLGLKKSVHRYYQISDALVLFSSREGSPNALLEAMACGLPCIISDVGDSALYVKDGTTGWIISKDDQVELRRVFDKISSMNISALDEMGQLGRRLFFERKLDKDSMINNYELLYESITRGMQ